MLSEDPDTVPPTAEDTPYVLVIHGTWNGRTPDLRRWYQLPEAGSENFCSLLDDRLEAAGLGRPVWRASDGANYDFGWSGENSHDARIKAAGDLCALLLKLTRNDPSARISLIAHSHGGNVVIKAIELYLRHLRSHKSFQDQWLNDPQRNRLGRIVFLGTPFFYKEWALLTKTPGGLLKSALLITRDFVLAAAFTYIVILQMWWMYSTESLLDKLIYIPKLPAVIVNASAWPLWLQGVGLFLSVTYCFIAQMLKPQNTNVYFDEGVLPKNDARNGSGRTTLPLDALVVTAGLLDEALLGMSAEPLVFAALVPQIRSAVFKKTRWGLPPPPVGASAKEFWHHPVHIMWFSVRLIAQTTRNIVVLAFYPAVWLWRTGLASYLKNKILQVVSAAAFGLPPTEFAGARIAVRTDPGIPKLMRCHLWATASLLINRPTSSAKNGLHARIPSTRYAYLFDPTELKGACANS